ncbi:D-2-hydroxyacid dehydrogenase family protein [Nisaea sp.]|uniref:D-2-hydroxyacid dehydrogenase family protein n=1 Tax=Nisaea sp. TaxID=2024842 RepID=UPI003B52BBD5
MPRIAILDDYANVSLRMADWGRLPEGYEPVVFTDNLVEHDALVERLKDFEIVCAMRERTPFTAEIFNRLPNLKLFVTSGMRNNSVDFAAARACGIPVCGTATSGNTTKEHTWAMLMALARQVAHDDRMMREGKWQTRIGIDLMGRTLGVIGLGKLGSQVSEIAKVFGMDVVAWSPNLTEERCAEVGVRKAASKEDLLREADIVTLHVVLSDRSRHMIDAKALAEMKPTALLVNTSRGPIVDEGALIDALKNNRIAGAAVDVFEPEPLPADHPIRDLDNILLTPHMGYVTEETYRLFYGEMVEDIEAWHAGSPIRVLN